MALTKTGPFAHFDCGEDCNPMTDATTQPGPMETFALEWYGGVPSETDRELFDYLRAQDQRIAALEAALARITELGTAKGEPDVVYRAAMASIAEGALNGSH